MAISNGAVLSYSSTGSGQASENCLHQFASLVSYRFSIRFVFAKLVAKHATNHIQTVGFNFR